MREFGVSNIFRLIGIISAPSDRKMRLKITNDWCDLGAGRTTAPSNDHQDLSTDVAGIAVGV